MKHKAASLDLGSGQKRAQQQVRASMKAVMLLGPNDLLDLRREMYSGGKRCYMFLIKRPSRRITMQGPEIQSKIMRSTGENYMLSKKQKKAFGLLVGLSTDKTLDCTCPL